MNAIRAAVCALLVAALPVWGASLEALLDDGRLAVTTAVEPASGAVPGQRLRLQITVATPRWFTGGTRIVLPEVPDLVILQNQDFALNTTERRGGETWTAQRWTLDVFALRAGSFQIPPITLSTGVSIGPAATATGDIEAPGIRLEIALPDALVGEQDWVASPALTLEQTLEVDPEVALGAAIERRISVSADDVMAMMLPEPAFADHPGLQRYPQPPRLANRANRGSLSASRSDAVTYIATRPGAIELPPIRVHWWNTVTGEFTALEVPGTRFTVVGELPPKPVDWRDLIPWGLGLAGLAVAVVLLRLAIGLGAVAMLSAMIGRARAMWREFRRPGLPDRLNPGGSSGQPAAALPPGPAPGSRGHQP